MKRQLDCVLLSIFWPLMVISKNPLLWSRRTLLNTLMQLMMFQQWSKLPMLTTRLQRGLQKQLQSPQRNTLISNIFNTSSTRAPEGNRQEYTRVQLYFTREKEQFSRMSVSLTSVMKEFNSTASMSTRLLRMISLFYKSMTTLSCD